MPNSVEDAVVAIMDRAPELDTEQSGADAGPASRDTRSGTRQVHRADRRRGLGWPSSPTRPLRSLLGWPQTTVDGGPAGDLPEQQPSDVDVAGVTAVPDQADDDAVGAGGGSAATATAAAPGLNDAPAVESLPTPAVPRETGVGATDAWAHESTPLASSVEHVLQVRQGRRSSQPLARPDRTRVMAVVNQKGGVGKTTTTVNVAAALAQLGLRVLVVDLDPQGNASTALGIDHHRGTPSTYDALVDGRPLVEIVQASPELENLFVVPATIDLAGAEIELVSMVAREGRLRRAIHAVPQVFGTQEDRYDFVLVDCPPSLGLLTLNALVAADEMLIPIQAEYYALEGLGQLLETVEMVKAHLNPDLTVSTIVLTMYDARTRLAAGVAQEVRGHFAGRVLSTAIPRSVRISEAPSYGQTVMTYDPGSPGALSYLEAAREMAERGPVTTSEPTDASAEHDRGARA